MEICYLGDTEFMLVSLTSDFEYQPNSFSPVNVTLTAIRNWLSENCKEKYSCNWIITKFDCDVRKSSYDDIMSTNLLSFDNVSDALIFKLRFSGT